MGEVHGSHQTRMSATSVLGAVETAARFPPPVTFDHLREKKDSALTDASTSPGPSRSLRRRCVGARPLPLIVFFGLVRLSQVTLHVLPLALVVELVRDADVLHQGAAADVLLVLRLFAVKQTVVAGGHQHVPLLRGAGRARGFGDVREVRQLGDVVQQAARLGVGRIAVGVAVLLLDVPAQLPALPLLQDLRLHLGRGRRERLLM